jgi:hypothetical protein
MGPDYVSELWSSRDLFFIHNMICMESHGGVIVTGENPSHSTLSTTNPTWTDQVANPGLLGERPVNNRLIHCSPYALYHAIIIFTFFNRSSALNLSGWLFNVSE